MRKVVKSFPSTKQCAGNGGSERPLRQWYELTSLSVALRKSRA